MIPKILVSLLWVGTLIVAQDCPLPSWTVKDVKTKLKDAVGNGGSASLTIIPTGTDKAETLTCASLQGNYRCHIVSKAQPGLEIDIQINTQVAHVSVTQMKFACGSATKSIAGNTDIDLTCGASTGAGADLSCASTGNGTIQAVLI